MLACLLPIPSAAPRLRRLALAAFASAFALLSAGAAGANSAADSAEALADRMLGAIGGRAAWARVRNLVNDSQQNRSEEPTVVRAVIHMDFERPRFRIETTGPSLHLIRAVDGERNWRLSRAGRVEPVPPATLDADRQWYAGHVYRTLHRIAARDPALRLQVGSNGRLEVFEGAARIAWYVLDARGEPYAFGGFQDDLGSLSGPWEFEKDGLRHPIWTAAPDGTFRVRIRSLTVNATLNDSLFARPTP